MYTTHDRVREQRAAAGVDPESLHRRLIEFYNAHFSAGDLTGIEELLTSDLVWSMNDEVQTTGRDAFVERMTNDLQYGLGHMHIDTFVTEDDMTVSLGTLKMTPRDGGPQSTAAVAEAFTFREDRIARIRTFGHMG
ncbi:nuclear transport factor 2 family protein [Brevibacterium litoralis]|uniref:nuclear transport factor 2 family protein n=1 Tax=Brevibacterium litoralis TaxID=3138935 RepID=UPI0032EC09D5